MRRLLNLLVVVGGLALSALPKVRAAADRAPCQNNLRCQLPLSENSNSQLGPFSECLPGSTSPGKPGKRLDTAPSLQLTTATASRASGTMLR